MTGGSAGERLARRRGACDQVLRGCAGCGVLLLLVMLIAFVAFIVSESGEVDEVTKNCDKPRVVRCRLAPAPTTPPPGPPPA